MYIQYQQDMPVPNRIQTHHMFAAQLKALEEILEDYHVPESLGLMKNKIVNWRWGKKNNKYHQEFQVP